MRRSDILKSATHLLEVIEKTKIKYILSEVANNHRGIYDSGILLEVYQQFSIEYNNFTQEEKKLLEIFNLDGLSNSTTWSKIIDRSDDESFGLLYHINQNLELITDFLPKVTTLFKQDYLDLFSQDIQNRPKQYANKDVLTVILPEEGDHFSKPLRLSEIINGIIQLYHACAYLCNESPDDIVVLAIDSGSDKSFDFLGNAAVIKCVKETITEIWDRIVFHKYRLAGERVELVAKTLPVLEQINKSESEGNIEPEQAEILRRTLIGGAEKFIATGAVTPELDTRSYNNPRKLMAPEPKMLVEKTISGSTTQEAEVIESEIASTTSNSQLSEDEMQTLRTLMQKMNTGNSNNGDTKKKTDDAGS